MRPNYSGVLVFLMFAVCKTWADMNIFIRDAVDPVEDELTVWKGNAVVKHVCSDSECDRMTLSVQREGVPGEEAQQVKLMKRFILLLAREECSFYRSEDANDFAAFMSCSVWQQGGNVSQARQFEGTFFDRGNARFDLMINPGVAVADNAYSMTKITFKGKTGAYGGRSMESDADDLMSLTESLDRVLTPGANGSEYQDKPLRLFQKPTIELVIGYDLSFWKYFLADDVLLYKEIGLNVITADALYHKMGISVKLVGTRFWPVYGFSTKTESLQGFSQALVSFVVRTMVDFDRSPSKSSRFIKGKPDAIFTMTQLQPLANPMGIATAYDEYFGGHGNMKAVHMSHLTKDLADPHRLHHYWSGVRLAHEIGHILSLLHPPNEPPCITESGQCIMSDTAAWRLPFWIRSDMDFVQGELKGKNSFLMTQDVDFREADEKRTKYIRIMSPWFQAVMYVLLLASIVFVAVAAFIWWTGREWHKVRRGNDYRSVHDD